MPPKNKIADQLKKAFRGKSPTLHQKVLQSGYLGNLTSMSATQIAIIYHCSPQAVGQWHRDKNCPRNPDATYSFLEVLAWKIEIETEKKLAEFVRQSGGDPNLMGSGSPALENYRIAATDKLKWELETKKGHYILKTEVNAHWVELGRQLAQTIEILNMSSPDAAELLRDRVSGFQFTEDPNQQREMFSDTQSV